MGSNNKGGLVGGFDILRLPNAPEVSGTAGADSIDVVFTDPSDIGGGSITSRTASATTGGTTTTATGTGTTVTITGLSSATFTVGGFVTNDFGNSPDSDTVSVQILFDRAVFMGGYNASSYNTRIDYITIASTGNASNFGTCTACSALCGGIASSTRGVFGEDTSYQSDYQYITFASTGNAANFGDLINRNTPYPHNWGGNYLPAFFSGGGIRGITYGGYGDAGDGGSTYRNWIEYITIASTGNGTDFGDAVLAAYNRAGFASSTRGVCGGGEASSRTDSIDYITIASTGNGTDFGNLSASRSYLGAASSSTRGIFAGGYTGLNVNIIEYITIASTGNATDFGDLLGTRRQTAGASSNVRAVFGGGTGSRGTWEDEIDYVTIASTGNASDFGDLRNGKYGAGSASSSHGGLH